jgi:glycosyltransferase involved in cell wall biosynthesis
MGARRVLFLVTTLDVGGAEKHLLWLTQGLRARGHQVDVVYLKGQGRLTPAFEELGARVAKVTFESPLQVVPACLELASLIRRGGFDVVHTHLLKADVLGALAGFLARHRAVISTKHNEEQVLKRAPVALVHGMVSRIPARVIALSDHVLEFVATAGRVRRDKLVRIYYGIEPARFAGGDRAAARAALGVADGVHVAACVARFHPQKDHPTLFRAAARLQRERREFLLLLIGGDPFHGLEPEMRAQVAALGLDDRVRFLGIRDDVPDLLAASDLFVLPSLFEGLGLVFLEAMAAGLPVLSTDCSAIPEVVEHGRTGVLIPVGDDEALAREWARFQDDRELGRRLGGAGRESVARRFGLGRMVDETVAVYREATALDWA